MISKTMSKGQGIEAVETISEEEMERRLEAQHDEVVAMLKEAEESIARGDVASLEPLHVLLKEARENFEAGEQRWRTGYEHHRSEDHRKPFPLYAGRAGPAGR